MRKQLTTTQYKRRSVIRKKIITTVLLVSLVAFGYIYGSKYLKTTFPTSSTSEINFQAKTTNTTETSFNETTSEITQKTSELNTPSSTNLHSSLVDKYSNDVEKENNTTFTKDSPDNSNMTTSSSETKEQNTISTNNEQTNNISENTIQKSNTLSPATSEEIENNNDQIKEYQQRLEELETIKNDYNSKVHEIEVWYNEEFNKNYALMVEAQMKYEELGGYATQDAVNSALNKVKNADEYLASMGMTNSGYSKNYKDTVQNEYNTISKRYTYSQEYDSYYEYINITLPAQKNNKLSVITQEYNKNLQDFQTKYNM